MNPGTFYVSPGATSVEETLATAHFLTRGFFNGRKWKMALQGAEVRRQGVQSVELFRKKPISGMRVLAVEKVRNGARRMGLPVKATSVLAQDLGAFIERGGNVFLAFSRVGAGREVLPHGRGRGLRGAHRRKGCRPRVRRRRRPRFRLVRCASATDRTIDELPRAGAPRARRASAKVLPQKHGECPVRVGRSAYLRSEPRLRAECRPYYGE